MTPATHDVFMGLAHTSQLEERDPEVFATRKVKGHLTNIKKAGLITTYVCDGDRRGILWVSFTASGMAHAAAHGVSVWDNRTGTHHQQGTP